jgi:hypothetical protein
MVSKTAIGATFYGDLEGESEKSELDEGAAGRTDRDREGMFDLEVG